MKNWHQGNRPGINPELLVNDTYNNVAALFRQVPPIFEAIDQSLAEQASQYGYPNIHNFRESREGLQRNVYSHRTYATLTSTPDLTTVGTRSFPADWKTSLHYAQEFDVIRKYLPLLPTLVLTHTAQLLGPAESIFDQFLPAERRYIPLRTHTTSIGLYPVFTNIEIIKANNCSETELGIVKHSFRYGVSTPREILEQAYQDTQVYRERYAPRSLDHLVGPREYRDSLGDCANLDSQHQDLVLVRPELFCNSSVQQILLHLTPALIQLACDTILSPYEPEVQYSQPRSRDRSDVFGFLTQGFQRIFSSQDLQELFRLFSSDNPSTKAQGMSKLFQGQS